MCSKRSSFIYQLDRTLTEVENACGQEPKLKMDWKSFASTLEGNDTYRPDDCLRPIQFFKSFCETDPDNAKKILKSIQIFECTGAGKDQQALSFKDKKLLFMYDPTNDWRSDKKGLAVAEFVNQEMKKIFQIKVSSSEDKRQASKEQEEIKSQVQEANTKAKKKVEKYQAETKRLTEWLQKEIQNAQNSGLPPTEKSKKMQEVSEKYQAGMEKASKEYSEAQ
jgi:hypothetical protein